MRTVGMTGMTLLWRIRKNAKNRLLARAAQNSLPTCDREGAGLFNVFLANT
jgi:hypothetical protein